MTRRLRILGSVVAGALISPWLPLYVARAMTRAQVIGHAGDRISYEWQRHTLDSFLDALQYMRPDESPSQMLALNLVLALAYAALLAWLLYRLLARLTASN